MNSDIEHILGELYEIDPSLKKHEELLRRIIPTLLAAKPELSIDDAFVARLKSELMQAHASRTISGLRPVLSPFFSRNFAVVAVAAVVVIGGSLVALSGGDNRGLTLAINTLDSRAFGSLAQVPSASPLGGKNAGPEAADVGASTMSSFAAPAGLGGGTDSARSMTYPAMMGTQYSYGGGSFTIPESGYAYKRTVDESSGAKLVGALRGMNFGVSLDSFRDFKVRTIEMAEDRDYGYAINLSVPQGTVSINANWEKWYMEKREYTGLTESQIPSDEALIAIADRFLSDHRISTDSYGEPVIDGSWRNVPEVMTLDGRKMPSYVPDTMMITYPLTIEGTPVYESWGIPSGLQVTVDIREGKVTSVNNLGTLGYERSEYALETDIQKIKNLATTGGTYAIQIERASPAGIKTLVLDTPTLVLMKYYRNSNSRNEELLIPAMRFPIRAQEPGSGPTYVMVPVVKDIVDSLVQQPPIMDGGPGDSPVACTMEVKECPDGSYVGRVAPSCAFAACPSDTAAQTVTVKMEEKVSVLGVTIRPTDVLEDSRCPADVQCIQAGTVRVNTSLTSGLGTAPQIFSLNTPITTETETITLVEVMPLTKAAESIEAEQYQFVFAIRKR